MNTPANGPAKGLRTRLTNPCGPVVFHGFTLREANLTSATVTVGTGTPEADGADDVFLPTA